MRVRLIVALLLAAVLVAGCDAGSPGASTSASGGGSPAARAAGGGSAASAAPVAPTSAGVSERVAVTGTEAPVRTAAPPASASPPTRSTSPHPTRPRPTSPSPVSTHPTSSRATVTAAPRYAFPVVPADGVDYAHEHHDYPATDIFTACGSNVVAVTDGVLQEVRTVDVWDPATNDPAVRGGLTVSLIGKDGVRYYEAHFQDLLPTTVPGEQVVAGQLLGHAGESGDARGLGCHVHLGLSPPCGPGDWSIRRGVFYPWPYLDSWRSGGQASPVAAMRSWLADHRGECTRHRLDDPIPDP